MIEHCFPRLTRSSAGSQILGALIGGAIGVAYVENNGAISNDIKDLAGRARVAATNLMDEFAKSNGKGKGGGGESSN